MVIVFAVGSVMMLISKALSALCNSAPVNVMYRSFSRASLAFEMSSRINTYSAWLQLIFFLILVIT